MQFSFVRSFRFLLVILFTVSLLCATGSAQTVHSEVLVVYNTRQADSLAVANHYLAQRSIPTANLCGISPPATDLLSAADYAQYVQTPVQNCLKAAGSEKILYIVMSYLTPYAVAAGPQGNASIDSYLADLWDQYVSKPFLITPDSPQPYYADAQSQGNVYTPFQSFASFRASSPFPLLYSVWRLDGATAAAASALVDQAIAAEGSGGPSGQACIDRRYGDISQSADAGYSTGDWDLRQASSILQQAGITVIEDANDAEFGTAPAPLTCSGAAFYAGWYSYNNYNDAFQWQTGAIGWHLDSASAVSPRGGSSWAAGALAHGITVTTGAVAEPYLEGLVQPDGAFRNLLEGANVGDAFLRNTRWLKWEILNIGDPLYRPFPNGRAPFHPLQPVSSLALSPRELVGGGSSTGIITLSGAAPAGGLTFSLAGPSDGSINLPSTVTVAAGSTTATFTVTTKIVSDVASPVLTASGTGATLRNTLVIDPTLATFYPASGTTTNGASVSVPLLLNDIAPAGGVTIYLTSDSSAASVPSTVTVPAGSWMVTVTVGTTAVATATTAHIVATYAGRQVSYSLSLVPVLAGITISPLSPQAGQAASVTVALSGPAPSGGYTIDLKSSDASVTVPSTISIPAGAAFGTAMAAVSSSARTNTVVISASLGVSSVSGMLLISGGGTTPTASVAFLKSDTSTSGNWKAAYGADGFNVIGDSTSYPAYATVTPAGQYAWTWSPSTSDTRALQKSAASDRTAAAWYSSAFSVDVNIADGKTHQIAIYLLDWDGAGRSQTITLSDVGTNQVLDSRSISNFTTGTYLVWNVSGHVMVRFAANSGPNAAMSGIFFGGLVNNGGGVTAAAQFVRTDSSTSGTWKGVYGGAGYAVMNDSSTYPSYATVIPSGQLSWTWAAFTTDTRALQKSAATDRIAATWYSSDFSVDINLTDSSTHQLAVYCVDWDASGRSQTVSVLDAASGAVLDTRIMTTFNSGQYLVWNVTGHVRLRFTVNGGPNAVLSGIFFDAVATSTNIAQFVKTDSTTSGNWKGVYGAAGYNVFGDITSYPSFATVTPASQLAWTWASSTIDIRALQKVSATDRAASAWYSASSFAVHVTISDGKSHQIAVYCLDWDGGNTRSQKIDVLDGATGAVLDSRSISKFSNGEYLVWSISGHVRLQFTNLASSNAVLSGIFF